MKQVVLWVGHLKSRVLFIQSHLLRSWHNGTKINLDRQVRGGLSDLHVHSFCQGSYKSVDGDRTCGNNNSICL